MLAVLLSSARAGDAQQPVEIDSAGVRIVENRSRSSAPVVFRLGAKILDIGGPADDPDHELAARSLAVIGVRLSDGSIAVPDISRVQFFDNAGRRTTILGRAGSGPAEFRSIGGQEFCRTRGDTLVAGDLRNGRFAVISAKTVVRTAPYSQFGGAMVGCFDDGTVLMQGGLPNFRTPTYVLRLARLKLDGTVVKDLGEFVFRTPNPVSAFITPTVRPWKQRLYMGDGATSEIRVYSANGDLTRIIRSRDTLRRVTGAEIDRARRNVGALQSAWNPSTYPAYSTFLIDPGGGAWVRDFVESGSSADRIGWTAFDVDGRLIGRLEVPRSLGKGPFSVVAFGLNEVQVAQWDDDGFKHLAYYQILRVQ